MHCYLQALSFVSVFIYRGKYQASPIHALAIVDPFNPALDLPSDTYVIVQPDASVG